MEEQKILENAIHCLKVSADSAVCEDCDLYPCDHSDVEDMARVTIKVLEKQMAKKPTYVDTRFRNHSKNIADGVSLDKCYKCPNCDLYIFHVFDSEVYCKYCGQLLDWN